MENQDLNRPVHTEDYCNKQHQQLLKQKKQQTKEQRASEASFAKKTFIIPLVFFSLLGIVMFFDGLVLLKFFVAVLAMLSTIFI